eukprot:TRINITY_DN15577_c0_g1_i7.p1 TRINITY_DN15577_c0_g1~~TRINITY_DN15577_c0_g1_i7.p1  ORF type:complete len:639 (+),score=129.27 TRINITY_DN15577_c0_g1_i7:164-1918(+)
MEPSAADDVCLLAQDSASLLLSLTAPHNSPAFPANSQFTLASAECLSSYPPPTTASSEPSSITHHATYHHTTSSSAPSTGIPSYQSPLEPSHGGNIPLVDNSDSGCSSPLLSPVECVLPHCEICERGQPSVLVRTPTWASIMRVVFYTLQKGYPDKMYFNLKTDVYGFMTAHWDVLCMNKKRSDNWHKQIQDMLSHSKNLFESGMDKYKQNGYWRMKQCVDPWTIKKERKSTASPSPAEFAKSNKRSNNSPYAGDDSDDEFSTMHASPYITPNMKRQRADMTPHAEDMYTSSRSAASPFIPNSSLPSPAYGTPHTMYTAPMTASSTFPSSPTHIMDQVVALHEAFASVVQLLNGVKAHVKLAREGENAQRESDQTSAFVLVAEELQTMQETCSRELEAVIETIHEKISERGHSGRTRGATSWAKPSAEVEVDVEADIDAGGLIACMSVRANMGTNLSLASPVPTASSNEPSDGLLVDVETLAEDVAVNQDGEVEIFVDITSDVSSPEHGLDITSDGPAHPASPLSLFNPNSRKSKRNARRRLVRALDAAPSHNTTIAHSPAQNGGRQLFVGWAGLQALTLAAAM